MTAETPEGRFLLHDDIQAETDGTREVTHVKTWKRVPMNSRVESTEPRTGK